MSIFRENSVNYKICNILCFDVNQTDGPLFACSTIPQNLQRPEASKSMELLNFFFKMKALNLEREGFIKSNLVDPPDNNKS